MGSRKVDPRRLVGPWPHGSKPGAELVAVVRALAVENRKADVAAERRHNERHNLPWWWRGSGHDCFCEAAA